MKQRRKVAILLVVTLVLQMIPLPVGSLAGVLGFFSVSQAAENTVGSGDNLISWSVSGTTLTLAGQGASVMGDYGYETYYEGSTSYYGPDAPWGSYANKVTSVSVTGVKTLGGRAFTDFTKLQTVTLSGVQEIGDSAFDYCSALTTVLMPNVTTVGPRAFRECSALTAVSMPEVIKIGDYAFSCFSNSALTTVSAPKATTIGNYAFQNCKSLTSVQDSGNVTSFGNYAFSGCSALETISLNADAKMGNYVFTGTGLKQVIWPTNNTTISAGAFEKCTGIQTITIPSQVSTIGNSAFNWCSKAVAIEGLDNVSSIGTGVFSSCNSLKDIVWSSQVNKISNSAFANCTGLKNITIPEHITEIGASAFTESGNGSEGMDASGITVTIPDSVKKIGDGAFSKCYRIAKFVIGAGVTDIGNSAFYNCTRLEDLEWKTTTLQSIGADAFSACDALTKFTVLASVTSIGVNPFIGGGLTEIEVQSGNTKYAVENKMLVTQDEQKTVVSYPCNAGSDAVVPDTVKVIGQSAFQSAKVSTVKLPDGLTSMGTSAFAGSSLTTVKLPGSLASVSEKAFSNTKLLASVEFQQGLVTIEKEAFSGATSLQSLSFPGSLQTIKDNAFKGATALTSVDGEGGRLTTIGASVFEGCSKLKDIRFGGDLEVLGKNAFLNCISISKITLPDKLHTLDEGVFKGCTSLKRVVFPNSVQSIGSSVLSGCLSLESVDFGSIIQEIKGDVFEGCYSLAEITISENNPNMMVENNVLYNKNKTKLIYYAAALQEDKFSVPEGVTTIGSKAFNYCGRCKNSEHVHLEELKFPKTVTTMEDYAVYYNASINKIFFYGDAPAAGRYQIGYPSYEIVDGKGITTTRYGNAAIRSNKVGSNTTDNNKGLVIFVLNGSKGWENNWNDVNLTSTDTNIHKLDEQYDFDDERWDPNKTDESHGKFPDTDLEWKYRDDIGEVRFIGSGASPDFEENNLFKWVDENAELWLDSIGEPKDYSQDVKLVDTGDATRIGKNTFRGCSKLYRVLSKECLVEIGEAAFADCSSLAVVDVSNVQKIEKEAFKNDISIKDDMDARGVEEIGEGAFSGCNGMTEILLGEGLKSLGKETFASCSALETMMLPESTKSLGEGCFTGCSMLRTINIPARVQDISAACFKNCSGLQKVYFYGDCPETREADTFEGGHENLVIYCRTANTTWDGVNDWNGIPVVHLDKFYTEKEDHYSFANTGSSFGYGSVYYIPLQRYVTATQSIIRGSFYHAISGAWGGSCFGMSSSSTEFYQGNEFDVKDYTAGAEKLYDVAAPRSDRADLTKLIEIYQVSQFESSISQEIAENYYQYRKLIKQVEEFERSGGLLTDETADPLIMCLYSGCCGHAVVPVAVNMDNKGNYILDVYDCNYPSSFQKLKISKDFKGIEYENYKIASFVRYSTIRDALVYADFTGMHVEKQKEESNTVAIAVNRENVSLVNGGDRDYKEIEDAYEQKMVSDDDEEFSGIRSFILPQGQEYKMKEEDKGEDNAAEEELKYYVATEDLFSEIKTSDEDAVLSVKSFKGTGNDFVALSSESEDTKTDLTVMDVSGIEKEISVTGKSIEIEVNNDSKMQVTVPADAEITVDGKPLELSGDDNKATVFFYAKAGENPIAADDLSCELSLDEDNKLSGTAQAYLTWKAEEAGNVAVTTKLRDENGNQIAEYMETKDVALGLQIINTKLQNVSTELNGLSGDLNVICEMTVADSNGNNVALTPVNVSLRAAAEEPAPEQPSEEPTTKPEETTKPSEEPTAKPVETTKPSANPGNSAGINNFPITIPATSSPVPSATVKPTETPGAIETVKPVETPTPIETVKPVETQKPVETPNTGTESSVPKKGQIKTVGALKYIITKSSEKNGTVAVHSAKKKNAKKITVPKKVKINGYTFKVTRIRGNAFRNMKKLSQVTLGANVKKVGNNAFKNCKKLRFVIIPGKVTTIGKRAFAGCTKLNRMLVKSNKLKSVGTKAFQGVASNMIVKTSKKKWKQYSKMFTGKGKMSHKATFIINPVKLKYGNKSY